MTDIPEPTVQVTHYLVTCVPEDRDPGGYRGISVEYRGDDRWAVLHHSRCLGTDGQWEYEQRTSERDDDWLDTHRFDEQTAIELAKKHAKQAIANGSNTRGSHA